MSNKTILVVDDIAENLDVIKGVLASNYKIKAAINGKIALKIIKKQKPDLILLDIKMPGMNGYELCQLIKDNPAMNEIPVIFLTGLNTTYDEAKGLKLGAVDYISKPINPEILKARIRTHLELSNARQQLFTQKQKIESLYQELNNEVNKVAKIHENNFLDEIPDCEGISLATYFQPAKRLGGDFYNFIKFKDKLFFYLSDVTGHGLEGVVFNGFLKEAIASYIELKDDDLHLKGIINHVYQQYLKNNYPDDYFLCLFIGALDLDTNVMEYVSAGFQTPPLVKLGDKEKIRLDSSSMLISTAIPGNNIDFKIKKIKLIPKTTLLFYTDGIAEQMIANKFYQPRLEKQFFANSHFNAEEIVRKILKDFQEFNNNSLQGDDDITFVVLKIK